MDEFVAAAFRERQARQAIKRRVVALHAIIWLIVNAFLVVIWYVSGHGYPWFIFPIFGWGIGLAAHAAATFLIASPQDIILKREERRLSKS